MRKLPPEIAENSFYKGGSADKPKAYPFKNTLRLKVFYREKAQYVQLDCGCLPIVVIGINTIKTHISKIWAFIAWLFVLLLF